MGLNLAPAVAGLVVVLHLTYLGFVALGGFLAWRWAKLLVAHLVATAWALAILVVGPECPLTWAERRADRWAGRSVDRRGFVDRHVEGVLVPESWSPTLRVMIGGAVLISWIGFLRRPDQRRRSSRSAVQPSRVVRPRSVQGP